MDVQLKQRAYKATMLVHLDRHGFGTCFFILRPKDGLPGYLYIITNHHVIGCIEIARTARIEMRLDDLSVLQFRLDPDVYFRTCKQLDYTVVAVCFDDSNQAGSKSIEYLPISKRAPQPEDRVFALGYPEGMSNELFRRFFGS